MGPAFFERHVFTMRITEAVEPGSLVIALGRDDKRIALPPAASVSVPPRIGIFRQLGVHDDFACRVGPLEDLEYLHRRLNEFEGARIQPKIPWKANRVATANRIIPQRRNNGARPG